MQKICCALPKAYKKGELYLLEEKMGEETLGEEAVYRQVDIAVENFRRWRENETTSV